MTTYFNFDDDVLRGKTAAEATQIFGDLNAFLGSPGGIAFAAWLHSTLEQVRVTYEDTCRTLEPADQALAKVYLGQADVLKTMIEEPGFGFVQAIQKALEEAQGGPGQVGS